MRPEPASRHLDTHFADETFGVHLLLEQHRRVADVVRRNEPVGVVHAGRMHRVPVDHAQRHARLALKPQLYHGLVDVMFVSTSRSVQKRNGPVIIVNIITLGIPK